MKLKPALFAVTLVLALSSAANAADGTWTNNASANWNTTTNWSGGAVAD